MIDYTYFELKEQENGNFYCKELHREFPPEIKAKAATAASGKYFLQAKVNARDSNGIPTDFEIPSV